MKKKSNYARFRYGNAGNLLKKMKLLFAFFFAGLLSVSAITYSQQTKLSMKFDDVTVKEVFKQIELQSEFIVFYNEDFIDVSRKVSVDVKNQNVESILNELFKGTKNTLKIYDRQIVILAPAMKGSLLAVKTAKKVEQQQQPQKKELKGTVIDSQKLPLPGVTVFIKGTTTGTITDMNGNFNLVYSGETQVLTFTFVGMKAQDIEIGNQTNFSVVMEDEILGMDEVVVVGYGTQKKATVTGAIASIGTKDLLQSPQANLSNALVGRMTGLLATQKSGEPGNDQSTLRIRGVGTFSGSADPLVMVDGIETANYNNIDPNEIESMSILKDASATAVYGIRGANGVLLITTKRGKVGKPQVSYSSSVAFSRFTDLRQGMNSYDYTRSFNEALKYDSYISGVYSPKFSDADIAKYKSHEDPVFYPDINWYSEMLKPYSTQTQHNININGGTEKTKYFVSVGYFNQNGMFANTNVLPDFDAQTKYKRYNFRSNFDFDITKDLTAVVNISSQIENLEGAGDIGRVIESFARANPLNTPGVINGKVVTLGIAGTINPYEYLLGDGYRREFRNYLDGTVRLNYKLDAITKGLSIHGTVSYNNYNNQDLTYSKPLVLYKAVRGVDGSPVYLPQSKEGPFGFNEEIFKKRKVYGEFGIDYSRKFGYHTLGGMVLYNQSKLFDPQLDFAIPNGIQGIVSRVKYDFANRYMAEVNIGYNGTENFAPGNRFGFFPAYSLGWVLSEESFFPKNDIVTLIKFRGSYGEVGNDKIGGDRFLYRPSTYGYPPTSATNGRYYFGEVGSSYNLYPVSTEGKMGNEYLTWERAIKQDFGVELGFLKDKIRVNFDLFLENRDNILANPNTIPALLGATAPAYNFGRMKNSGFDGDISYTDRIGQVNYWLKANITYAHNVVEYKDEATPPYLYQLRTGQRYGQFFGLIAEGLYNTWEEVNNPNRPKVAVQNMIQPGDIKYRDVNGDGVIDDNDQVPIGYSNFPEKVFSFSFGGSYKGFDFSAMFQGAANVSIEYRRRYINGFGEGTGEAIYFLNSWSQERYDQGLPIDYPHLSIGSDVQKNNYLRSSFWIRDASYLRLKNAEIGYTLSPELLKKIGIVSTRIYVNGNNLLTWSTTFPGVDPETSQTDNINSEPYPLTSTINLGINVKF